MRTVQEIKNIIASANGKWDSPADKQYWLDELRKAESREMVQANNQKKYDAYERGVSAFRK